MTRADQPDCLGAPLRAIADVVRLLPTPVALLGRDQRILAHSGSWPAAHLLADHDFLGRRHDEVLPHFSVDWREVERECGQGRPVTYQLDLPAGSGAGPHSLRWTATPCRAPDGTGLAFVVHSEVVTDRLRLQRALREREDFIQILFERSPIGLNLSRMDGLWVESNPAFLEIIGYSREEADGGLTYWDLTPRRYDADEERQLESLRRTGRYGPYEKEFIRKDGSLVPVRLAGFLIERGGETYIWSLIEDIREQRLLEQRVEREHARTVQSSKLAMLGEMAAGVAHEINNPLAIIDGFAGALLERMNEPKDELLEEAALAIGDAVRRASTIVDGLRKFAREDDGAALEDVPVRQLVEEALRLCQSRIRNHGVELRHDVRCDHLVRCGPIEFTQVLVNLIHNAFDAVRGGREPWISVEADAKDREITLCVRDSGPGIPAEEIDRVFQPFFTTKRAGEGTGLGLSISRGIIERLGGTLTCEPGVPHACFRIRIPVAGAT